MKLTTLTYGLALAIMIGWLLWVGQSILIPIIAAVAAIYMLSAATDWLAQLPIIRLVPTWGLRVIVLVGFTAAVIGLASLVSLNLARVAVTIPRYESNLDALVQQVASLLNLQGQPNWELVRQNTFDQIDTSTWITVALNSVRGFGGTFFFIVLYASFLFAERLQFAHKFELALGGPDQSSQAATLLQRINERIGDYLLVKTLINAILGAISYAILALIGIEYAVFWALLIAVLNYIPYVGSLIGVIFPVLLSLGQFGAIGPSAITLVTLTIAQVYVGSFLEPRLMGRTFNLSPLVVLLALAFWSALWGVPGAILAVPMTASLVIVLAEIDATRPIAIMLSANGQV